MLHSLTIGWFSFDLPAATTRESLRHPSVKKTALMEEQIKISVFFSFLLQK